MKLKKIVSLALAGIMAVSMLAGCNNGGNSNNGNENEDNGTVSGYSATLAAQVDTDKEYVSFKDNASDAAALQKALNYISANSLNAMAQNSVIKSFEDIAHEDAGLAKQYFKETAKLQRDPSINNISMAKYAENEINVANLKEGVIYVVNGAVGVEEAIKQVADEVSGKIEAMPEKSNEDASKVVYNYDYTVSVSVATKALGDNFTGASNSATFIAVTVTRNVTEG